MKWKASSAVRNRDMYGSRSSLYLKLLGLHGGREKARQEMVPTLVLRERQPLVVACIAQELHSTAPPSPPTMRGLETEQALLEKEFKKKNELVHDDRNQHGRCDYKCDSDLATMRVHGVISSDSPNVSTLLPPSLAVSPPPMATFDLCNNTNDWSPIVRK